MAAIYFHIPFCKQACHYCNFHFSTSLKQKESMLEAMVQELSLRKQELPLEPLQSIYFGGGTPSVLQASEIAFILNNVTKHFSLKEDVEITLEMNPDDRTGDYIKQIKREGVNRLSVGIQSFFDNDLKQMNRVHTAKEALDLMDEVVENYTNFSLDLIYGLPNSTLSDWKKNIELALSYFPPHISAYALTIEDRTVLAKRVADKSIQLLKEEAVVQQFDYLVQKLEAQTYEHYELSSFCKKGFHSKNNTAYWSGTPYLGIGPSAHSYYQEQRSWNVQNNPQYIKGIMAGNLPIEREKLSKIDRYNEYIMTGLRTSNGVSLTIIRQRFGQRYAKLLETQVEKHLMNHHLYWDGDTIKVTQKAKFLVDGIASDLFLLNL